MSATNTTTNYGLPIFIETDKPAWLVDFNGAMRTIDTQLKTNADAIATKSPILTFNDTSDIDFTKTGDIITANLQPEVSNKVGRALITPLTPPSSDQLVAIDSTGNQEALGVGSGLSVSAGQLHAIDLNLTEISNYEYSDLVSEVSGISATGGQITVAMNASKTICKIYGRIVAQSTLSARTTALFRLPYNLPTLDEQILISPAGIASPLLIEATHSSTYLSFGTAIRLDTDNRIRIAGSCNGNSNNTLTYFPCIYFIRNFGDVE